MLYYTNKDSDIKNLGFGNLDSIERVQFKFLKHILNIKSSTPNNIVYGETGVFPIEIDIKTRMVAYWAKLIENKINKLALNTYSYLRLQYDEINESALNKNLLYTINPSKLFVYYLW